MTSRSLRNLLLLILGSLGVAFAPAYAQEKTLKGKVTDAADGTPLSGVTIRLKENPSKGVLTSKEGTFSFSVPGTAKTLVVSFVGYDTKEVAINGDLLNIQLNSGKSLNEIVVVGYGTQRKKDLTGSVVAITSKDFVKGPLVTPEQLIAGKVAGVQITSNGGAPGSGSRIRIRGGSSLNANNDPLIVIDGVPLDNAGIAGSANPLNFINPNDIASFNILKDASATAIYGSRASNGVIIITTKKGSQGDRLRINFNSLLSLSQRTGSVDVLSADQFRKVVTDHGSSAQKALLGSANTNWQDIIFKNAVSSDHNLSVSGAFKAIPYRISLGYLDQNGILKTSNLKRTSASVSLSPSFLNNDLKVELNLKGAITNSRFADQGAIGAAVAFDPTQPVYANNNYGGYFEWLDPSTGKPNTLATRNPLSLLMLRNDKGTASRSIGNIQFDYRFHFLPELRANLNVGYDVSKSEGTIFVPANSASVFNRGGVNNQYSQSKANKLLEFYLNYVKDLKSIHSRIDVTGGYSYQDFLRESPSYPDLNVKGDTINPAGNPFKTQNTLISFFGRINYALQDRYLLTATVRRDGSSRFSPSNRWGTFPSAALAWRIKEESFLKNSRLFSDLKFRLGYGITGQQDVLSDYPYLARYTLSDASAQYQFGNAFYRTLRPEGYDANIKWEQTQTSNIGLDFGFLNGRLSGSIDYYFKKTKDLLSVIPVPAGSNLTNQILTNVGNIENKGVEFVLNASPVQRKDINWDMSFNITYNENKITNLTKVKDPNFPGVLVGGIAGGVGNTIQIHTVGYPTYSFFVYKQVYDKSGKPIEALYADLNKDGKITPEDRYRYKSPEPNVFFGFSSQLSYKKWSLGFVMRGSIGNYMYNNFNSNYGAYRAFSFPNYLSNVSSSVLNTNFREFQLFSDYYVENASFLRMDNINIGYNFGKLLRLSASVQNAFVITQYSGLDPEIAGGIDYNFYPRPRVYSLGVNLDF